jgi:hypothetical protein
MKVEAHAEKVRRLADLRRRLDPLEDFELWYWTTLTAGTQMYNATLHLAGLTSEERVFSTIPGVHVVPQPDGTWVRELRGPGDVSHVGWPPIEGEMPAHVQSMEDALHALEVHRDPCLRGDRAPTPDIIAECEGVFARVMAIFEEALIARGRAA